MKIGLSNYFGISRNYIFWCFLFLAACGKAPEEKRRPPPPSVSVERLSPELLEVTLPRTGGVHALQRQILASPAEGPLLELRVREGDAVAAGQILARIGRPEPAEAAFRSAGAEQERASKDLDRVRKLADDGVATDEQLERARATAAGAESALDSARRALADHELRAPSAGVVGRVLLRPGHYVTPRAAVLEIVDPDRLTLRFDLPERHAALLRAGDEVSVRLDMAPEQTLRLPVSRLHPELDPLLRTRTVEVDLPADGLRALPGAFARVEVTLSRHEKVLTVPVEALQTRRDGSLQVWRVGEENRVEAVTVEILAEADNRAALRGPLLEGDRVVVSGGGMLRGGMTVRTGDKR